MPKQAKRDDAVKFTHLTATAVALTCLAGCGGGSESAAPAPPIQSSGTMPQVTGSTIISGKLTYDRVPHTQTSGLDYANSFRSPIRGAVVEAVDASGEIVGQAQSNAQGDYSLTVDRQSEVRLLVKSKLFSDANAKWDFSVTDNTQDNQLYALQGSLASSGTNAQQTRDLHASHGWTGRSYGQTRSAAPFAILDSVYSAVETFVEIDPNINFPALELRWSVNNKTQLGSRDQGQIGTSAYFPDEDDGVIYLLGEEGRDTDEYDQHVILHEWGHYFEDKLSRSDSIGGLHSLNDRLDARVAFSEGWGNALSAMITGDPIYKDSGGTEQASGFSFDINSGNVANPGWFNEASIGSILYGIFDSSTQVSEGIAPFYHVMTSEAYKDAPAFTTIFALSDGLRREIPGNTATIDRLLETQSISGNGPNGNGERNSGAIRSALPVYKEVSLNGTSTEICSVDDAGLFNKLGNREFIFLNLASEQDVEMSLTKSIGDDERDPDFNIWQGSELIHEAQSSTRGEEVFNGRLAAGGYVIEVFDFFNVNGSGSKRSDSCYNFRVSG